MAMTQSPRRRKAGFSLVEVTLSIGILAFGGITMLGLLSVGLGSFQKSAQNSTSSAIRDQIVGNLQQAGWAGDMKQFFNVDTTTLAGAQATWVGATGTPQTQYFDDQANLLASSTGAVYQAIITPVVLGGPNEEYSASYSGPTAVAGAGPSASPSLIQFQIVISRNNGGAAPTIPGTTVTYTAFVGHN